MAHIWKQLQKRDEIVMEILDAPLAGLKRIVPRHFFDDRGYFLETYQETKYEAIVGQRFVQDNLSHSRKGVLRGLHYQFPDWQGKLVYPITGEIFDVAVDLRPDSLTVGHWYGEILSAKDHRQLYIPPGFAHGFCVLSDEADVIYKCTAPYNRAAEYTLAWDDPEIAVRWPIANPIVSEKDQQGQLLSSALANVRGK